MADDAWYADIDIDDVTAGADRIRTGTAGSPAEWGTLAVEGGIVDDQDAYHDRLRAAALHALDDELETLAGAADRELVQLVRMHDGLIEIENELRQRITEVRGELGLDGEDRPTTIGEHLDRLNGVADTLAHQTSDLEADTRRTAHAVVPNLAALAGPMLAARLVAAAGSLEVLARKPSSTMQVLGAEDALFVHLRGDAPSPKHGLIFAHPAVRSAPKAHRGRIARTLAGKLSIAARIDHYRGELEPDLEGDLEARLIEASEGGSP